MPLSVLGAVWKCGHYTHRDISIGNLLWHEGHVLVTDWEFRQCYDDEVTGKEAKMVNLRCSTICLRAHGFFVGHARLHGCRSIKSTLDAQHQHGNHDGYSSGGGQLQA